MEHLINELNELRPNSRISYFNNDFLKGMINNRIGILCDAGDFSYIEYISNEYAEYDILLNSLHNNYTDFFRNEMTFSYLNSVIIPKTANCNYNSDIRIWVNGCSTGEEAYSIAILFEEYNEFAKKPINYCIWATDIDAKNIEYAKKGVYSQSKISNLKVKYLSKYFTKSKNSYKVNDQLKERIVFCLYDVFDTYTISPPESIYGSYNMIFCCNLIYYYKKQYQDFILEKILSAAAEDCYIISGKTEKSFLQKNNNLKCVNKCVPIFIRK